MRGSLFMNVATYSYFRSPNGFVGFIEIANLIGPVDKVMLWCVSGIRSNSNPCFI